MKTRLALLGVLAITLLVWLQRGATNPLTLFTPRLGAPSSAVESAHATEQAWAIGEITADINEMSRVGQPARPMPTPAGSIAPWRPDLLITYAAEQIGPLDGETNQYAPADQHDDLLVMSVDAILRSSVEASKALERNMKNPRAHEAAALTLAAFAMRESAEGMSDTRWAQNRITAHLAVAQALRNGAVASIDGQLAEVALFALTDRQQAAVSALDSVSGTTPEIDAWRRALRMRVTQDWTALTEPAAATRLEKLEYFRARRATLRGTRAGQDLTELREPITVDFGRIAIQRSFGVEDGNDFIDEGLAGELAELAYVYRQLHQHELPKELPAEAVNARAGRLLNGGKPQVIPWGAWAEFGNRHIGMWIRKIDDHYRRMQGDADAADHYKRALDAQLGHLTMYPVASTWRTKGARGTEADLSLIDEAISVAVKSPELVTFEMWSFIETGAAYERVKRGMPKRKNWFAAPSADLPYDVVHRAEESIGGMKPPAIEALMNAAPYNIGLVSLVAQRYRTNELLTAKVRELTEPRVPYDMSAIDAAIDTARSREDRITLRRQACALTVSQCLELAAELRTTDEAAAAAEYEKAFANPALDAVAMTYASGWLVRYYERRNQRDQATALAERSAAVGSGPGVLTLARLYEERSQLKEADERYSDNAARYESGRAPLAAFLYRQAVLQKNSRYLDRWKAIEREVFPAGLVGMATEMKARPGHGVFVEKDSYRSRAVRLQAGDIIVGVNGWRVDNYEQLDTVLWFDLAAKSDQLTAWRGKLFTVDLDSFSGMTLKTHPLKGWIE